CLLGDAESNHPNGTLRRPVEVVDDEAYDLFRLTAVVTTSRSVVHAIGDVHELDAQTRMGAGGVRERDEPTLVEAAIGERNQRLVLTAVVPLQPLDGDTDAATLVEDALKHVELRRRISVLRSPIHPLHFVKEARRWQLLVVATNHELISAVDRAHAVVSRDLRGLVEDHEVEVVQLRVEELAHGERTHKQTRLQCAQQPGHLTEELPQRHVASLERSLACQQGDFAARANLERAALTLNLAYHALRAELIVVLI